jgi:hypothetical protein
MVAAPARAAALLALAAVCAAQTDAECREHDSDPAACAAREGCASWGDVNMFLPHDCRLGLWDGAAGEGDAGGGDGGGGDPCAEHSGDERACGAQGGCDPHEDAFWPGGESRGRGAIPTSHPDAAHALSTLRMEKHYWNINIYEAAFE